MRCSLTALKFALSSYEDLMVQLLGIFFDRVSFKFRACPSPTMKTDGCLSFFLISGFEIESLSCERGREFSTLFCLSSRPFFRPCISCSSIFILLSKSKNLLIET
uniref:Uncharacterized protein n=1 Tax=Cacopsylla melanoneura TaxID=428564 RepID=A0A8D8TA19_9HEMI